MLPSHLSMLLQSQAILSLLVNQLEQPGHVHARRTFEFRIKFAVDEHPTSQAQKRKISSLCNHAHTSGK